MVNYSKSYCDVSNEGYSLPLLVQDSKQLSDQQSQPTVKTDPDVELFTFTREMSYSTQMLGKIINRLHSVRVNWMWVSEYCTNNNPWPINDDNTTQTIGTQLGMNHSTSLTRNLSLIAGRTSLYSRKPLPIGRDRVRLWQCTLPLASLPGRLPLRFLDHICACFSRRFKGHVCSQESGAGDGWERGYPSLVSWEMYFNFRLRLPWDSLVSSQTDTVYIAYSEHERSHLLSMYMHTTVCVFI